MAKPKVTATDRLSNVLDVVELGRRTGMLSVERGAGPIAEDGEVYYVAGNPIYAVLGPLRGREALGALARWGECRFAFDTSAPQPIPNVDGVLPAVNPNAPVGYGYAPPAPNAPPGYGYAPPNGGFDDALGYPGAPRMGGGMPPSGPQGFPGNDPWNSPPTGYPSGGLGFGGQQGGYGYPGGQPSGNSLGIGGLGGPQGPSGAGWGLEGFGGANSGGGFGSGSGGLGSGGLGSGGLGTNAGPGFGATSPFSGSAPQTDAAAQTHLQQRPRRAPDVRDLINVVTTYNLSRAHRTMLLLADGEHSILDLARLSGKPPEEVLQLLHDLEARNLVYYA